jgi:hypothetical protein
MDEVEKILGEMHDLSKKDMSQFVEEYRNLPLYIFEEIESLAYSKTKKKIGKLARKVTNRFHNNYTSKKM